MSFTSAVFTSRNIYAILFKSKLRLHKSEYVRRDRLQQANHMLIVAWVYDTPSVGGRVGRTVGRNLRAAKAGKKTSAVLGCLNIDLFIIQMRKWVRLNCSVYTTVWSRLGKTPFRSAKSFCYSSDKQYKCWQSSCFPSTWVTIMQYITSITECWPIRNEGTGERLHKEAGI